MSGATRSGMGVRARLWTTLALLGAAILLVGAITWVSLGRVDRDLQVLHGQTLGEVARALDLSRQSATLATSAPYLMTQRSDFLLDTETARLRETLDRIRTEWPEPPQPDGSPPRAAVVDTVTRLSHAVDDLIAASVRLDEQRAAIRTISTVLEDIRAQTLDPGIDRAGDAAVRAGWWALQGMTSDAMSAIHLGNLIGVGEEQRDYLMRRAALRADPMIPAQARLLDRLDAQVLGPLGLFDLRRLELSETLNAQNALFRIRQEASAISTLATDYAASVERFLAEERAAASRSIRQTGVFVGLIVIGSLLLALAGALYVSNHVTSNIARVSSAMVQLASGDRSSRLPRRGYRADEIGALFHSFRVFRANALRLDRINRQLDRRNALFRTVFANMTDGIAVLDDGGRITAANAALDRILGPGTEEMPFVARLDAARFADAPADILRAARRGVVTQSRRDGTIVDLRMSTLPDGGQVWLLSDVTEQRQLAERLQQIDRIETLGKVAGDVAHDFGNVLTTISTHAHLLERQGGTAGHPSLAAIVGAVEYGGSLADRLLSFARRQRLSPEPVELGELLTGLTDLLEIGLNAGVTLHVEVPDRPARVRVDAGQLESALLNLVLNANHALHRGGTIRVTLTHGPGEHATIAVADDGPGMEATVLAHAVEPFFTTRGDSGGTGLGLSIVYGFIRQTGGDMRIDSTPNRGTRVTLVLPLLTAAEAGAGPLRTGRALLVEDDAATRADVAEMLRDIASSVVACADAREALAQIARTGMPDLLVTDVDLGGGPDGWSLAHDLRQRAPDLRILVMSGRHGEGQRPPAPDGTVLLHKPFTPADLAAATRTLT